MLIGNHAFRSLIVLLCVACGAYAFAVVARKSDDFNPLVDGVLSLTYVWVPTTVA